MKKRLFSLALALCMVLSLLPFGASAAEIVSSGKCGDNLTYTLDSDGLMTISGTGRMEEYHDYYEFPDRPYYSLRSQIKTVVIEPGVTGIGDYAFNECSNLTSVTIPDTVTWIDYYAFGRCTNLTSIALPDSVTSIGDYAFYECDGLTSVTLPDGLISFGSHAFSRCRSLTSITIPDSVTEIYDYAFQSTGLTSVIIPDSVTTLGQGAFNNSKITSISIPDSVTTISQSLFYACSSLTSVTIPDSVTSIGEKAFYHCTSLASVTVPESVTSIGTAAFSGCTSLKTATVSGSLGENVFQDCTSLESLIMTRGNTIYTHALNGCTSLASVAIPPSVTRIDNYAFNNCRNLTAVHISDLAAWCGIDFGDYNANPLTYAHKLYMNETLIENLKIPSGVTRIKKYAFSGCTGLTSVTMPDSVTIIGAAAFFDCTGLTSIKIPNRVTTIGSGAFSGCTGLTSIALSDRLKTIGGSAFSNCTSLTAVTIPNRVTTIGDSAFGSCTSLTSIAIPDSVTSIGGSAFSNCTGLTSVTIPGSVTSIGSQAFYGCTQLREIDAGKADIVSSVFGNCPALKKLTVGGSLGANALQDVTSLESLTMTGGSEIGAYAVSGCTSLTDITLPNTLTSVAANAFRDDNALANVYFCGTQEQWDAIDIKNSGNAPLLNAALTLTDLPTVITSQPKSVTAEDGQTVKFTIGATGMGLTYQWQLKTPNGAWKNTTAASGTTKTLSVVVTAGKTGYQYRCVITNSKGAQTISDAATLTVKAPVEITSQPKSVSVAAGAKATFSVTATGVGLTYQWQYSRDGSNWTNSTAASAKTAKLTTTVKESFDGRLYRCVVTDANGKQAISNIARLTVKSGPQITAQPQNAAAADGKKATFSVTAAGVGLTYQWQYSTNNGTTWKNSTATSAKTAKLTITAKTSFDGRLYRCVVTDANGKTAASDPAKLTVRTPLNITAQPKSTSAAAGEKVTFSVKATGDGLTYQWQYSRDGSNWTNSTAASGKTASLSFTMKAAFDGRLYRCVVKDSAGNQKISNAAFLQLAD